MSEKTTSRQVRFVEPVDAQLIVGNAIEYSDEERFCKQEGCITKLSGYRVRKGHLFCSAHERSALDRELFHQDHNHPLFLERRDYDKNMKKYRAGKEAVQTIGKRGKLACMDM